MDIDIHESVQRVQLKSMIKTLKVNYGRSLNDLIHIFASRNYEIRMAGETARDLLMNKIPTKLELVSSATLCQMKKLFTKKNVSITVRKKDAAITMRYGVRHYTFSISTICAVEIRKCDGIVKANWVINAYHRIFTINSIFIDFSARVYDHFHGRDDVMNGQIRMNIDPDTLIKDDYLRIFEYFKLYGSIASDECVHDRKTLSSIMANINGLGSMKGEVIWTEFKTILMQPKRYECMEAFLKCGGATYLGLPEKLNLFEFREVTRNYNFLKHPLLGISYLCAFLETQEDVTKVHQRLRLSAYERNLAIFLVKYKTATRTIDDLVYYRKMCLLPSGANKQISREYVLELLKYHNKKTLFDGLLVMKSTPHPIDPAALQWKKSQLRRMKVEASHLWYESDYEMGSTMEPLLFGMEWNEEQYKKSNKKQRLQ